MAASAPESRLSDLDPRGVEDALAAAVAETAAAAGADGAVVLLRARAGDALLVRAPRGLDGRTVLAAGVCAANGTPLCSSVLFDRRPIVTTTLVEPRDPLAAVFAAAGFRAWAILPLELAGIGGGTLHLLARADSLRVGQELLEKLARYPGALAAALRCVEIVRAAEARGDVVARFARGVLAHVEIDTLFPELIRLVSALCPCDAASVALRREDLSAFELVAAFGTAAAPEIAVGTIVAEAETAMSLAFRGETLVDGDLAASRFPRARLLAASGVRSAIYLPLGEPRRRGVLCIGSVRLHAFGDDDVALYQSLVPFLEIALRNAELISRMRSAYRELESTQERLVLAERLRALGEIAAGVAHEIGNALAVVGSHTDLIAGKVQDPELSRLVSACRDSVAHADRSIARVLELARGAPGPKVDGEPRRARLDLVAREAIEATRARWSLLANGPPRRGIDTHDLGPVPEAAVDPGEAREALVNLILNALDAIPDGGRVAIATTLEENQVLVAVDDDGPGVPEGRRERVFEPFFTTKGQGHAGLGLAFVGRLARRVGGSVRVVPGRFGGARFELRVPCQELGSGPHEIPRPARVAASGPATPGSAVSVLLVEDEPALRAALPQLLRLRGIEVTAVADVAAAIDVLESRPGLHVLVTDLGLPGRSGWDLVDTARTRFPGVAIVVLSGWGALTDPALARDRGVAAVLAKPTSEKELAETIEAVAAERRARDPGERPEARS